QSAANPSGRRAHGEPRLEEWGRDHGSFALAPRGGNDPLHGLSQSRVQQAGSARFAVERRADHSRGPRPVQRSGALTMALIRGMQFALRTLTRYPGAHAAAILILSLAIGTVVAILSIVDEILWSPTRGIEAPERTVQLFAVPEKGAVDTNRDVLRLPNVVHVQEHAVAFETVAWLTFARRALFAGDEPEEIVGRAVSGSFFPLMRTRAVLGRLIEPQDTVPGAA